MDDQRLSRLTRGPDMGAKTLPLPVEIAFGTKIIQTGLSDRHVLWVGREFDQFRDTWLLAVMVVRVHANGDRYLRVCIHQREHRGIGLEIDRYTQKVRDPRLPRCIHQFRKITAVRREVHPIEVAM